MDRPAPETAAAPREPASAVVAIGTMLVVALVAAGGVVAWARFGAPEPTEQAGARGIEEELPTAFADGSEPEEVPAAIAAAAEGPVVAVVALDPADGAVEQCDDFVSWEGEPELRQATVGPDGLVVVVVGETTELMFEEPVPGEDPPVERARSTCQAAWVGDRWENSGGSMGPADEVFPGDVMWGGGDGRRQLAAGTVLPPQGTAWVLQDRGGYHLAWPADGEEPVVVTWSWREGFLGGGEPPPTRLTYLDADGTALGEESLGVF